MQNLAVFGRNSSKKLRSDVPYCVVYARIIHLGPPVRSINRDFEGPELRKVTPGYLTGCAVGCIPSAHRSTLEGRRNHVRAAGMYAGDSYRVGQRLCSVGIGDDMGACHLSEPFFHCLGLSVQKIQGAILDVIARTVAPAASGLPKTHPRGPSPVLSVTRKRAEFQGIR
jgi:hypothetical protein